HVKNAVKLSQNHSSGLTQDILNLEGMSSTKNRCLLNNLLKLPRANYLEIGCWKGSTFISALYGNQNTIANATAIDNWSEFDGPYMEFAANCSHYLQDGYKVYSHDCFAVDPKTVIKSPVHIYFYDGAHSAEAQSKAFTYYNSVLDNTFIAIVDDWNHGHAREGTLSAFKQLKYKVVYEIYLPARYNGDREQWWHGLYVAVVRK
ncbi:MAG: class I SAM-dependent methyltransferase, partial [Chlamydiales bacterium]|nr:class I SAM-dependent methyltransferase [Chlamydiales bacterium]